MYVFIYEWLFHGSAKLPAGPVNNIKVKDVIINVLNILKWKSRSRVNFFFRIRGHPWRNYNIHNDLVRLIGFRGTCVTYIQIKYIFSQYFTIKLLFLSYVTKIESCQPKCGPIPKVFSVTVIWVYVNFSSIL